MLAGLIVSACSSSVVSMGLTQLTVVPNQATVSCSVVCMPRVVVVVCCSSRAPGLNRCRTTSCARCLQVQWLIDNYETAEGVSLPRSTLYNHYLRHCQEQKMDPMNPASFGKLIRSVFLGLRTRRLGTRYDPVYFVMATTNIYTRDVR